MTSNPTPLSPDDDQDFQQLTGVFDRPIAPCPAFAERLRQQAIADNTREREVTVDHIAIQPTAPAVAKGHKIIPIPVMRRSGGRILEIIAAAVLVVALLGSMFWMNRLQNGPSNPGPDPNGQQLAAITSPIASATPESEAIAGAPSTDPGHTNAFPAGFDPQTAQTAEPLGDLMFNSDTGVIVGDTLILSGTSTIPEGAVAGHNFIGVDLATGEKLWTRHRSVLQTPIAGPNAMYTIEMSSGGNHEINFMLVSVSPENGLPNWGQTILTIEEDELQALAMGSTQIIGEPIVIGDKVYVATATGSVRAFDTETGDLDWQTLNKDTPEPLDAIGGSLTGDDRFLYVVDDENYIIKLDRTTGEILDTSELADRAASYVRLSLGLQDDVLVVSTEPRDVIPQAGWNIYFLSTETGEVLWHTPLGPIAGSPAIANGIIGIPQIPVNDAGPAITAVFFDVQNGKLLGNVQAPNWGGASLSASGSVFCVHGSSPQLTCSDTAHQESGPQTIDIGTQYIAEGPPSPVLFWNGNAVILGHEGGPYIIRSGNQSTQENTPEAASPESAGNPAEPGSRGGIFGTTGNLNATYPDALLPGGSLTPTWSQEVSAPWWMMPYGNVVAALGTSDLTVFDAATGDVIWSQPVSEAFKDHLSDDPGDPSLTLAIQGTGGMALPWIDHGTLYITTASELVGLDLMTGEETFRTPHQSGGTSVQGRQLMPAYMVIDNGVAYLLSWPNDAKETWITAINLSSGDVIWRTQKDASYWRLIVSDGLVVYPVNSADEHRLVALNASDGSVAWETQDAILQDSPGILDAVQVFIAGDVVIETRLSTSATAGREPPGPEDALRIAAYDLKTGEVLWTSRSDDASWGLDPQIINGCGFYPRVSHESLIVPCGEVGSSKLTLISLPLYGNGVPEIATTLDDVPAPMATSFIAGETAWVYGADNDIVRLDLITGEITSLGTMGGETCYQRALPTDDGFVCLTTNNTGTYHIQAFGSADNATPAPSPVSLQVSAVQEDATPAASPEPTSSNFQPDYQSTGPLSVNLRWGPGIRYGVVTTVSPETQLQYLGESEPTRHPVEDGLTDDQQWMKVRTRNGDEGWIREVDITEYRP